MSRTEGGNFIVCASIAYMEDSVLLNKLSEVFVSKKVYFKFWGWNRTDKKVKKDYSVEHLWTGGGFSSKRLFIHYPIWILKVLFKSFTISKKDLVFAVALDVALPIYFGSLLKGYSFIFNNPDNFSLTYNLQGKVKWFVDKLEERVAKKALFHILPIESRFEQKHDNIVIFPNFPLESEIKKAREIFNDSNLDGYDLSTIKEDQRFKIYINGRMVYHRGCEWLATVFDQLDPKQFLIIVAGDIYCKKLTKKLRDLENVIQFAKLENYKALSLYYCADLVLAFYDPVLPINRKAAPNKWWDCVACQVPFVSNTEIETLSVFKEKDACFTVPYGSSEKLIELFTNLNTHREKLLHVRENLASFEIHSWEAKMDQMLSVINERTAQKPKN